MQCKLNTAMKKVVKAKILKLLNGSIIYLANRRHQVGKSNLDSPKEDWCNSDSKWQLWDGISSYFYKLAHVYWLLEAEQGNQRDHFPLPFIDQVLESSRYEQYCFVDDHSAYYQIEIVLED